MHQINEIIHDAVGDDAEIIFGAVHEPAMQGEIRVTVIATGFDRALQGSNAPSAQDSRAPVTLPKGSPVIPFPANRPVRASGVINRPPVEAPPRPVRPATEKTAPTQDLNDMEIPTFIRRQMD